MTHFSRSFVAGVAPTIFARCAVAFFLFAPLLAAAADNTGEKAAVANDVAAEEARLFGAVKYLASDDLEGRGIGSKGLDAAADYMAQQFAQIGLKTDPGLGGPFQKFPTIVASELGPAEKNHLQLVGPAGTNGAAGQKFELKFSEDFTPLAIGGSGTIDLPIVFAGYGITAKDERYDDFAGVDVKGKAVIILRHEPQQNNPHSAFNGTKDSKYAPIARKVSNAYEHGAGAVILVNDDYDNQANLATARKIWQDAVDRLVKADAEFKKVDKPSAAQVEDYRQRVATIAKQIETANDKLEQANDPLMAFERGGIDGQGRNFPVVHCRRAAVDPMVQDALHATLAALEKRIDEGAPTPRSAELPGWRLVGEANVVQKEAEIKNVIGVLEGEGALADETIVIGAHYDHLGRGQPGTLAPGSTEIHNGADDNASGAGALLEIARELAGREKKLPRRIVFIAFTGEERGLLGSARYCREPIVPLENTVAMLNLDMVGRLKDEKLIIYGTETAAEFNGLIDWLGDKYGFVVKREPSGFGPSDHSSFYAKHIPVLHFFTGSHADYHRPTDDYDKINVQGMRRVTDMVAEFAVAIAEAEKRPQYKATKQSSRSEPAGDRPYFGSIPDFGQDKPGYALSGVTQGGPAEKAGLQAGDVIVKLGDSRIGNLEDFDSALRKWKAGDRVPVVVKRGESEVTVQVLLETPK